MKCTAYGGLGIFEPNNAPTRIQSHGSAWPASFAKTKAARLGHVEKLISFSISSERHWICTTASREQKSPGSVPPREGYCEQQQSGTKSGYGAKRYKEKSASPSSDADSKSCKSKRSKQATDEGCCDSDAFQYQTPGN